MTYDDEGRAELRRDKNRKFAEPQKLTCDLCGKEGKNFQFILVAGGGRLSACRECLKGMKNA